MKHILNRTIVTTENKTLAKGSDVTNEVPKSTLERWVLDGLVSVVEEPGEFLEKVNKKGKKVDPAVEALDPDAKPRSI